MGINFLPYGGKKTASHDVDFKAIVKDARFHILQK
jgi:hypothetical protein